MLDAPPLPELEEELTLEELTLEEEVLDAPPLPELEEEELDVLPLELDDELLLDELEDEPDHDCGCDMISAIRRACSSSDADVSVSAHPPRESAQITSAAT